MSKEEIELLTSPIERPLVGRLFVIGGPLGLAVALLLSLWVSQQQVTHAVIVQGEPQWVGGETLAMRVQVTPESPTKVGEASVAIAVEQGGVRHELGALSRVHGGGMAQGRVVVPSLTPGAAILDVNVEASPFPPRVERIPIEVVAERTPVPARHVVSTSMSQYADDSDPQPEALKIDVRPRRRVLAGFENELMVRVTEPAGKPWSGPLALRLVDGEFAERRGNAEDPPLVWEGHTDAAGLALVHGLLSTEVLRVLVQLRAPQEAAAEPAPEDPAVKDPPDPPVEGEAAVEPVPATPPPPKVLHERKIRLVSFAGAVLLTTEPLQVEPGGELEVLALGLSAKRPVFVDVYDPDGAWVDTFDPPIQGREPARPWSTPAQLSGLLQLEAYHFTNAPGESTAVARVLARSPASPPSLREGLEQQRGRLSLPRNDRTWDEKRERGYLDALEQAEKAGTLPPQARAMAQRWVIDTLPVEVHGPPLLLSTRERDLLAMREHKLRWIFGLRLFVFGGGGLYLVAMTVLMLRSHARDGEATIAELRASMPEGEERELLEADVRRSKHAGMMRGLLVVAAMAAGLVTAVLLLEILVWEL
ncbi:hypothetical protein [Paraliomyxa miuraensis]|uniref:hypothetical protein n=1 Tax=Paraliomyxa miuraensis TaxID=376150 RepID=UPI00225A525F|nr:hypothetical protein [Paraliomyxa miuraensis]MCX4245043.1 hypothetical protein [Paraliomyxa miuraensis]